MDRRGVFLVVITLSCGACGLTGVAPPPGCEHGACPGDLRCDEGNCFDVRANDRPVVVVGSPQRGISTVTLGLHVIDDENDDTTITAVAVDDFGDTPLTATPATLGAGLGTVDVALAGFTSAPDRATPVHLRVTAADAGGPGPSVTLDAVVGNCDVAPAGLAIDGGLAQGLATIRFNVHDDDYGTLNVTRVVIDPPRADGTDDLMAGLDVNRVFPQGFSILHEGEEAALVWDSALTHPQSGDGTITLDVADDLGSTTSQSATFVLQNAP